MMKRRYRSKTKRNYSRRTKTKGKRKRKRRGYRYGRRRRMFDYIPSFLLKPEPMNIAPPPRPPPQPPTRFGPPPQIDWNVGGTDTRYVSARPSHRVDFDWNVGGTDTRFVSARPKKIEK
jgi:hypothetical protein